MPRRDDIAQRPGDRLRADRHRPGLRVRLLRHPGLPRAARRGPARHPGQLQPGDDHDRPEFADATYVEPITPEFVEQDHRQGAPRRAARHARRPDRAQHRDRAARGGRARAVRRRADRRQRRRDPGAARTASRSRRSSARCPRSWGAESARSRDLPHAWTTASPAPTSSATRSSCGPSFTMGGAGSGIAYDEADLRRIAGAGLHASARPPRCCSRSRSSAGRSTSSS